MVPKVYIREAQICVVSYAVQVSFQEFLDVHVEMIV